MESSAATTILRYGIRPDSGGPGKWRGGVGLELTFTPHLSGSQVLGRGMERFRFVPWGLLGGRCGTPARTVLNFGRPDERELGKIDVVELNAGDTITILTPGGGGYGDPLERDPEAVLADVRRGERRRRGPSAGRSPGAKRRCSISAASARCGRRCLTTPSWRACSPASMRARPVPAGRGGARCLRQCSP